MIICPLPIILNLSMIQSERQTFHLNKFCTAIAILLTVLNIFNCKAQSSKEPTTSVDTTSKTVPENRNFTVHIVEHHDDGSKGEIDTVTGYRKYWFKNGKLQMEGKVTRGDTKDYRDSVWKYYNEAGQLMLQETYTKKGKTNSREFMYFINNKPMSETYQYYEGDYKDKSSFKFHKIEKMFYTNGQVFSERHSINGNVVDIKCWDAKGNPKPLEYMNTVKSMSVDE